MLIKAIHEIIYSVDGKRAVLSPGVERDLPSTIVDSIPASAYQVVAGAAEVQEPETGSDQVDLTQLKVPQLLEIAAGLEIAGADKLKKADLVAAITAKRAKVPTADTDDELV